MYTVGMDRTGSWKRALGFTGLAVALCMGGVSWATIGNGVFQGFVHHIAQQIDRDKVDFAVAESCTSWFYEQLKKPSPVHPDVQRLSFVAEEDSDSHPVPVDTPASMKRVRPLRTANPRSR